MKQVFQDARQHFIHFDQGFVYTIRELLLRPGHAIREYIEGKRVRHIRPVKFMFWAVAISFLMFHFVGLDQDLMQKLENQQQGGSQRAQQLSQKIFQLLTNHPAILMFAMIPLIALWSWLLFRRRGYNYAEHFVLNVFLMGELSLASIFTAPISKFVSSVSSTTWAVTAFSVGIWVAYFGWSYGQFFQPRSKAWAWIKGGMAILLGYFLMIMVIAVVVMIVVVFFKPQLDSWLAN